MTRYPVVSCYEIQFSPTMKGIKYVKIMYEL